MNNTDGDYVAWRPDQVQVDDGYGSKGLWGGEDGDSLGA